MVGSKVCSHCESVIPADSKVCPNCGAGLEAVEPEVNQFNPVSSAPQQSPSTPQYTQTPATPVFSTSNAEPRKSKKFIYIIIAAIVVFLLCVCILGIISILSFRTTG